MLDTLLKVASVVRAFEDLNMLHPSCVNSEVNEDYICIKLQMIDPERTTIALPMLDQLLHGKQPVHIDVEGTDICIKVLRK